MSITMKKLGTQPRICLSVPYPVATLANDWKLKSWSRIAVSFRRPLHRRVDACVIALPEEDIDIIGLRVAAFLKRRVFFVAAEALRK